MQQAIGIEWGVIRIFVHAGVIRRNALSGKPKEPPVTVICRGDRWRGFRFNSHEGISGPLPCSTEHELVFETTEPVSLQTVEHGRWETISLNED